MCHSSYPRSPPRFQSMPGRPRPSTSNPSGTRTALRPAGVPLPTANRRNNSLPPPKGRRGSVSGSASLCSASSSPPKKRKSKTADTLNPLASPRCLREKPSKFWLASGRSGSGRVGGGDAPAFSSLSPLGGAVGPVDESQLRRDETERMERGRCISGGGPEGGELVATGGEIGQRPGSANGLSVDTKRKKSSNGSKDGQRDVADKVAAVSTKERRILERCFKITSADAAAADALRGKNVLDWTAADVQTWVRALPRGLAAFARAEAFANGRVDGKILATLTLSDLKRKEFRHAGFKAKVLISIVSTGSSRLEGVGRSTVSFGIA